MTQLTFADVPEPLPFQRGSETSKAAAEQAAPSAKTLRAAVLRHIVSRGAFGATDEEMQRDMPMQPNTQRPRRRELALAGLIADSGVKRLTASGCKAVVWIAKEQR
jgi:hypothetical protein